MSLSPNIGRKGDRIHNSAPKNFLNFANFVSKKSGHFIKQNKYNKLRREIEARREEVKRGEILSHEEIWRDRDI
jgi:hypothetical protein